MISSNTLNESYNKSDYNRIYRMVKKDNSIYRRNILQKMDAIIYPLDDPDDVPMDPLKYYDRSFNCKENANKD